MHAFYTEMHTMFDQMMTGKSMEETTKSDDPDKIKEIVEFQKDALQTSRTAKLWIQYMEMIDILKMYLKAERLGNWELHLKATAEMLPLLLQDTTTI